MQRSIPAWAGETIRRCTNGRAARVYPRVGGGNCLPSTTSPGWYGLSPRGRGKQVVAIGERELEGSIPAWAGETREFLR